MYNIRRKELIVIATARISVNVDEETKQNAQKVFGEIGLDMTTAIETFLRTVVREGRIPYELRTEKAYLDAAHQEYIRTELEKAKLEAADPNTVWLTHEEVVARIAQRREARSRV